MAPRKAEEDEEEREQEVEEERTVVDGQLVKKSHIRPICWNCSYKKFKQLPSSAEKKR